MHTRAGTRDLLCLVSVAILMLDAIAGAEPMRAPRKAVVPVAASAVTGLYGNTVSAVTGTATCMVEDLPECMVMRFSGHGAVTWEVDVPEEGEYEVAVCYAAELATGMQFEVAGKKNRLTGTVHLTTGTFGQSEDDALPPRKRWFLVNYERVPLKGVLQLPRGASTITLRVTRPKKGDLWDVRSIELTPVAAREKLAADRKRAIGSRASTDSFVKSGYGVMFHWTDESAARVKPEKEYQDAVRSFDVDAFTNTVQETGAGWVIFTVNHESPHCPAPIRSWEDAHPGWTTERDLLGEIAEALDKKGIELILYMATHLIGKPDRVDEDEYLEQMTNVRFSSRFNEDRFVGIMKEFGERYGKRVAGFWFDGWDLIPEQYPGLDFERMFKAAKVGNANRIVSYNYWIFPDTAMWQEYWGGEIEDPKEHPKARYMKTAVGEGMQWHGLLTLEKDWIRYKSKKKKRRSRIKARNLIAYIQKSMEIGGMVTVNLGIFQDGTIPEEQLEVMQTVREAIREQ